MEKHMVEILLLAVIIFFVIRALRKEHEKSNRYFGGEIKHTAEEQKTLDYYSYHYVAVPENTKLPSLVKDGFELEDIALTATQGLYETPIPTPQQKQHMQPGDSVKLLFVDRAGAVERMWVELLRREGDFWVGELSNDSFEDEKLRVGKVVYFHPNHVYAIAKPESTG